MDDLERRLADLGAQPIDPATAQRHRLSMSGIEPRASRFRFGWRGVAAAAVVGFLAGSTGLAAAGSLPDPAQDFAHDVLGSVGVDVPRSTEGCPEGRTYRNHGQYVSEVEAAGGDVEAAAHSDCGKPVKAGRGPRGNRGNRGAGPGAEPGVPREDTDGNPCTGPPPWAGAHLPPDQRRALQEERRAACGDDAEVEDTDEVEEETTTTTG